MMQVPPTIKDVPKVSVVPETCPLNVEVTFGQQGPPSVMNSFPEKLPLLEVSAGPAIQMKWSGGNADPGPEVRVS